MVTRLPDKMCPRHRLDDIQAAVSTSSFHAGYKVLARAMADSRMDHEMACRREIQRLVGSLEPGDLAHSEMWPTKLGPEYADVYGKGDGVESWYIKVSMTPGSAPRARVCSCHHLEQDLLLRDGRTLRARRNDDW